MPTHLKWSLFPFHGSIYLYWLYLFSTQQNSPSRLQGLPMQPWLAWNSLCSLSHRSACLCLPVRHKACAISPKPLANLFLIRPLGTPTRERHPPLPPQSGTDVSRTCPLPLAQRRRATSCPLGHTHSAFGGRNRRLLRGRRGSRDPGAISRELAHLARSRSPCLFFLPEPGFSPLPPRRRSFFLFRPNLVVVEISPAVAVPAAARLASPTPARCPVPSPTQGNEPLREGQA